MKFSASIGPTGIVDSANLMQFNIPVARVLTTIRLQADAKTPIVIQSTERARTQRRGGEV
jgi:hypothetical protein